MRSAGFTTLLLWTAALATTSHAAPVTLTFHAEIVAGPMIGTAGTGFFTWESEAVNPEGIQTLFYAQGTRRSTAGSTEYLRPDIYRG